jgi:transcriptional regulator with XRE-family HTH domain
VNFGEYLRGVRRKSDLKIKDIEPLVGKLGSYLSELERGLRPVPSDEVILALENALNVPKGEMLCIAHLNKQGIKDRVLEVLGSDLDLALEYYRCIHAANEETLLIALKELIARLRR